jgi:hypothetical protein
VNSLVILSTASSHALTQSHSLFPRATSTCSLGIGRQFGSVDWDITVYNVPEPQRQDANIIGTLRNAKMDKGQNLTLTPATLSQLTITNIDNAVVFSYDSQELNASISDVNTGKTKVNLSFEVSGGAKWTTANCTAGSVVISAGRESWSCNFPCTITSTKEL